MTRSTPGQPPVIALRPATPADSEFCYQLHRAAMGAVIAAVWGWDEPVQRAFHDRAFAPGAWQVITADGADAGMLAVQRRPGELYLARIELLPAYQGQAIGTRLIRGLQAEAREAGQPLVLEVLAANHRARALYQRLGLREAPRTETTRSEDGLKIVMRSGPA